MGKSLLCASINGYKPTAANDFFYNQGTLQGNSTRNNRAIYAPVAGTLSLLTIYVDAVGSGRTLTQAIDTGGGWANGNESPTIPDTTAGAFADTTHTDSISASNHIQTTSSQTASTATYWWQTQCFQASSGQVALYNVGQLFAVGTVNGTSYIPPDGFNNGTSSTLAVVQGSVRVAGSWSGLAVNVSSYTSNGTCVIRSNISGVAGNQTVTIPAAGGAGFYADTTHSDSVSSGDLIAWQVVLSGRTTGTGSANSLSSAITATSGTASDVFCCGNIARSASATVHYTHPAGSIRSLTMTTETEKRIKPGFAFTISNFRVRCSANTCTGSLTVTLRKNGVDQIILTVPTTSTSIIEDTVSTLSIGATDDFSISITGGTSGSATVAYFAYKMDAGAAAQSLFRNPSLDGLSAGGPHFANPLGSVANDDPVEAPVMRDAA